MSPELEQLLESLGKGFTVLVGILIAGFILAKIFHSLSKNHVGSKTRKGP